MTTKTKPAPNGTEAPDLPSPEERIAAFRHGLEELRQRHQVAIVPLIKTYPNGRQVADVEIVAHGDI